MLNLIYYTTAGQKQIQMIFSENVIFNYISFFYYKKKTTKENVGSYIKYLFKKRKIGTKFAYWE